MNLIILIVGLIIAVIYKIISVTYLTSTKFKLKSDLYILKYYINYFFFISFILQIIVLILYTKYSYYTVINNLNSELFTLNFIELDLFSDYEGNILDIGSNTMHFNILLNRFDLIFDFFGLILLILAYIVGYISILTLDTRLNLKNINHLYYFNIFIIIVYFYISVNNILIFFMFYEFLMVPSFFIIYYLSNSRRSVQSSLYFIMWTQLGSFLVLIAISYIIFITNFIKISDLNYFKFTTNESIFIFTFIFLGFGFKVPIWPFHYWLTKTHVEAPSGFSIYLSGFLVKSALYGFYKIFTNISINFYITPFLILCIFGVIDSSLKMWGQTDLKKLVAYGTIQEMNLIYLSLCIGDSFLLYISIIFTITHALLSTLMFFIVDCIYRRFNSRSIIEVNGINHTLPNLTISVIIMIIFFSGLPGSIKFISEFCLLSSMIEILPIITIILVFISNVLGLIGFSKVWFNSLFGSLKKNTQNYNIDLSYKELYIIWINFIFMFLLFYFLFFIF
jgi:NADH:ubiquinone oxidoreductase subunit 4 (subunit M)